MSQDLFYKMYNSTEQVGDRGDNDLDTDDGVDGDCGLDDIDPDHHDSVSTSIFSQSWKIFSWSHQH